MSVKESDIRAGRINDQLETELNALPEVTQNFSSGGIIDRWKKSTLDGIERNPWAFAGGALIGGILAGILIGRR